MNELLALRSDSSNYVTGSRSKSGIAYQQRQYYLRFGTLMQLGSPT